ncbi:anti-sigma factor [soil metagenome]
MQTDHEELKSLIAPYLLGAVDDEEKRALEAHLRSCEECRQEAGDLSPGVLLLAEQVRPVDLPPGLAERIVDSARAAGAPAHRESPTVRRLSRGLVRRWAAVGVAAVLALLVGLTAVTIGLVQTRSRLEDSRRALAAVVGGREGIELSGGSVAARLVPTEDGALFVAAGLDQPPEGKDYELWLIEDGKPAPAGTFESEGEVTIVPVTGSLGSAEGAAVTLEPDGGSKQPTSRPLMQSS